MLRICQYAFVLSLLFLIGCKEEKLSLNEYFSFFRNIKNGYSMTKEIADLSVDLTLFPPVFEAYKEAGAILSDASLDSLMVSYDGFAYFYLRVSQHESEHRKPGDLGDVFSSSVKPLIWIDIDGVRIDPILNHHGQIGNATSTAVYVFDLELFDDSIRPKKLKTEFVFNYLDFAISQDTIQFHFDTTLTNSIPDFKF